MAYIGAPYNFVPFAEKTYSPVTEKQMGLHDKINPDEGSEKRYTGEIRYQIEAKTPIMVDDGAGHFFKSENGKYAIPGSTMRGLIRENVQILGASDVRRDIDDYRLMYRHVAAGALKGEYGTILGNKTVPYPKPDGGTASVSILQNVKAGYIRYDSTKKKYVIYPTKSESVAVNMPNYYVLSEKTVASAWMKYVENEKKGDFAYDLLAWEEDDGHGNKALKTIMQHMPNRPFRMKFSGNNGRLNGMVLSRRSVWYRFIRTNRGRDYYDLNNDQFDDSSMGFLVVYSANNGSLTTAILDSVGNCISVGSLQYVGTPNDGYVPYSKKCSYKVDLRSPKNIIAVSKEEKEEEGWLHGWVVSTGKMNNKKVIYIIPEKDGKNAFELSDDDIKSFSIDYNKRENTLKALFGDNTVSDDEKKRRAKKEFYLPEKDAEEKPVFYINTDVNKCYFSFTPHLRLFHEHTVAEGIKQTPPSVGHYDLATSMFGLSDGNRKKHYKSKVSFTDAELLQETGQPLKEVRLILAEPKASSYLDYLDQSNGATITTYNSPDFKLRGMKQYWLRDVLYTGNTNANNDRVGTKMKPIESGAGFVGTIRFQNLDETELGLLLWSVRLNPESDMNIGKGKPYGYGRIKVKDVKVRILNTYKAYNTQTLDPDPFDEMNESEIMGKIEAYKETVVGGKPIKDSPSVIAFFKMKDSKNLPKDDRIRYMSIDDRDYQNRKQPLHTVEQALNPNYVYTPPENNQNNWNNHNRGGNRTNFAGNRNNQGGNRNNAEPQLKPITAGSNIIVVASDVFDDNKTAGRKNARFEKAYRMEAGKKKQEFAMKGIVFGVPSGLTVGEEVIMAVTKAAPDKLLGEYRQIYRGM